MRCGVSKTTCMLPLHLPDNVLFQSLQLTHARSNALVAMCLWSIFFYTPGIINKTKIISSFLFLPLVSIKALIKKSFYIRTQGIFQKEQRLLHSSLFFHSALQCMLPADLQMESTGFPVSWNLMDHHELKSSEIIGARLPSPVRSIAGAAMLPWKWERSELIRPDLHCWAVFNGPMWLEESSIVTWYRVI